MSACVIAACGPDPHSSSTKSPAEPVSQTVTGQDVPKGLPHPCSLLTPADIQQTLGVTVTSPDPPGVVSETCNWVAGGSTTGHLELDVNTVLVVNSDADYCDAHSRTIDKVGSPVDGLDGTARWYDLEGHAIQQVCVDYGAGGFVLFSFLSPPAGESKMVALAKIARSRI